MNRTWQLTDQGRAALADAVPHLKARALGIHGQNVRFYSDSEEVLLRVDEGYSFFRQPVGASASGSHDLFALTRPDDAVRRGLIASDRGQELLLVSSDLGRVYSVRSSGHLVYELGNLFTGLVESVLYSRFLPIHGAAVTRNGVGTVLVGQAGAGKSSITLSMIYRGFSYSSDDVVLIERESGLIYPFPRLINLRRSSLTEIRGLSQDYAKLKYGDVFGDSRWFLDRSDRTASPFPFRNLVILDRRSEVAELSRLAGSSAILELLPHVVYPVNPYLDLTKGPRSLALLSVLISKVSAYRLAPAAPAATVDLLIRSLYRDLPPARDQSS